jgi:PadR family transcriptional regulator, regulatory protein PadR
MANFRSSKQTLMLLGALTARAANWHYGYALTRETGLRSGTLYPILMRLEERGWLETKWENQQVLAESRAGRPPRHMYRLTASGRAWATEALAAARPAKAKSAHTTLKPARQHPRILLGEPKLERS